MNNESWRQPGCPSCEELTICKQHYRESVEAVLHAAEGTPGRLVVATMAWDTSHAYRVGDGLVRRGDRVAPERASPLARFVGRVVEPLPSATNPLLYLELG
jgi:hypothetical protein